MKGRKEVDLDGQAVIKVIGIGGGGGNAITHMLKSELSGVNFYAANTDKQALDRIDNAWEEIIKSNNNLDFNYEKILIGSKLTKGLGAGAEPLVGKNAVEESISDIKKAIHGANMLFITAGMGGGTGTGGISTISKVAKEMGILTIAVVTKPFSFEGNKRIKQAEDGIKELVKYVDSLIVIPNDKLISANGRKTTLIESFASADNVLKQAVDGISKLIIKPGMINVDFADVKTVMSEQGIAIMGSGNAIGDVGEGRASKATLDAINSPLLEQVSINGAKGLLVNIISSGNISIGEFNEIGDLVSKELDTDATIVIGTSIDETLDDEIVVTIVASGVKNIYKDNNIEKKPIQEDFYNRKTKEQNNGRRYINDVDEFKKIGAVNYNPNEKSHNSKEILNVSDYLKENKHLNNENDYDYERNNQDRFNNRDINRNQHLDDHYHQEGRYDQEENYNPERDYYQTKQHHNSHTGGYSNNQRRSYNQDREYRNRGYEENRRNRNRDLIDEDDRVDLYMEEESTVNKIKTFFKKFL